MAKKNHVELSREQIHAEEDALIDFQFALIDAMNERGMTKAELAKVLGVSRARVSQMFSSSANPTLKLAARALFAVGMKHQYCNTAASVDASSCNIPYASTSSFAKQDASAWLSKAGQKEDAGNYRSAEAAFKWMACQRNDTYQESWTNESHAAANHNFIPATEAA